METGKDNQWGNAAWTNGTKKPPTKPKPETITIGHKSSDEWSIYEYGGGDGMRQQGIFMAVGPNGCTPFHGARCQFAGGGAAGGYGVMATSPEDDQRVGLVLYARSAVDPTAADNDPDKHVQTVRDEAKMRTGPAEKRNEKTIDRYFS